MQGDRQYLTGLTRPSASDLRALAEDVEALPSRPVDWMHVAEIEARVICALVPTWEIEPAKSAIPERKEGRKIVQRYRPAVPARIARSWRHERGGGTESTPAPRVTRDIAQAWGLLNGRILITLSDIAADGLALARVCSSTDPACEGEGIAGTAILALVAAILRSEAALMDSAHGK